MKQPYVFEFLGVKEPKPFLEKDLEYKCGWSPMEGATLNYKVCKTFVNGKLVYDEGKIDDSQKGKLLTFTR